VTHFAAAYLLGNLFPRGRATVLFYVGAVLPDVLVRPAGFLFHRPIYSGLQPLHLPLGYLLAVLFISLFFEDRLRKKAFLLLLLGGFLHLAMDALQLHVGGRGYLLLFPFSWTTFEAGWFRPEASLPLVPYLLPLMILIEGVRFIVGRRRTAQGTVQSPSARP
jgi:hypothetical protein